MRFLAAVFAIGLTVVAQAQYGGAKPVSRNWKRGFDSINESEAKRILNVLAGPDFRGRSPRNGDYMAAAGYVAEQLRSLGVAPAGDNGGYFQRFVLQDVESVPEQSQLATSDGTTKFIAGQDFKADGEYDYEGDFKFAFVKVPAGASTAKLNLKQLKGRWVIYHAGLPTANMEFFQLMNQSRPVIGILGTSAGRLPSALSTRPRKNAVVKGEPDPRSVPYLNLELTQTTVQKIAELNRAANFLNEASTEASIELGEVTFRAVTKVKVLSELESANVVGILRGADADLSQEAVLYGSHLDHLGVRNGQTYWGADDNGSGCTANLMIAKAIIANPVKPKRSVIFGFWSLEEEGTHGSWAYALKPAVPWKNVVACINMDMLGRNESTRLEKPEDSSKAVYPGIAKLNSVDLYELVVKANEFVRLDLKEDKEDRTDRSDTRNAVVFGVPTLKAFTGEHEDYHRPGDQLPKINWTKLTNITKWLYLCGQELASQPGRPRFERKVFRKED